MTPILWPWANNGGALLPRKIEQKDRLVITMNIAIFYANQQKKESKENTRN